MYTQSLWNTFSASTDFPSLNHGLQVEVTIIGGGITGVTTAQLLAEKGINVAVLEARKVGGGTTSHSTGNLYFTIDKVLSSLKSKYDIETIQRVAQSRSEAVDFIEENVKKYSLDCDFKRVPWYFFSDNKKNTQKINDEQEVGKQAGLSIEDASSEEIPVPAVRAVKSNQQAQFNAMRYTQELAKALPSVNCAIYENTQVLEVNKKDEEYELETTGGIVKAKYVIHATHTPKGVKFDYHTVLGPYREYGVAGKLASGNYPEGIFWGYYGEGNRISLRSYKRGDEQLIIAVGEHHKVGQSENNMQAVQNVENYLRANFDVEEVTHRWGGQHYKPADFLPYIGRQREGSNTFVATGFSTDGLTYGTLAAMIISDSIAGKENKYLDLYDARRHQPLKAAQEFIKENVDVAKELVKGLAFEGTDKDFQDVKFGEGSVVSKDGKKLAVYKKEDGTLEIKSAICTHLGCVVHWNNAENSWDCPCHGSRFEPNGQVLEGPAFKPLKDPE